MFQNKFVDFKNPIVLHNVTFNMNITSETVVRIVTSILNTSAVIDRESPTKVLLKIEESICTEMNQYLLSDVSVYRQF